MNRTVLTVVLAGIVAVGILGGVGLVSATAWTSDSPSHAGEQMTATPHNPGSWAGMGAGVMDHMNGAMPGNHPADNHLDRHGDHHEDGIHDDHHDQYGNHHDSEIHDDHHDRYHDSEAGHC